MANPDTSLRDRFITALLIGAIMGVLLGTAVKMFYAPIRTVPKEMKNILEKKKDMYGNVRIDETDAEIFNNHPAMVYIKAYQEGKWETIVEQTLWIQERLKHISKSNNTNPQILDREKRDIINRISVRDINKNYITKEGVEDQYIFSPEAKINIIGIDNKGPFIDKRIKEMVWIQVEYPQPSKALRNEKQIPIKSLVCALAINSEGKIVKSSIIGNAKIDFSSIKIWYSTKGEK